MKTIVSGIALALVLSAAAVPAEAKGCIKGAVVGGIAGHYAGHHAMLGAAAGCLVGRHIAKTATKADAKSLAGPRLIEDILVQPGRSVRARASGPIAMEPEEHQARAFFGRRKGHRLRKRQAELIETLLPRLAIDLLRQLPPNSAHCFRYR